MERMTIIFTSAIVLHHILVNQDNGVNRNYCESTDVKGYMPNYATIPNLCIRYDYQAEEYNQAKDERVSTMSPQVV